MLFLSKVFLYLRTLPNNLFLPIIKKIGHILIVGFLIISSCSFSKDTLETQHILGFGIQRTPNTSKTIDHLNSIVNYNQPGKNLFYRFSLSNNKYAHTTFTGDFFYRSGHMYTQDGGLGGNSSYYGNFEFLKFDFGVSQFGRLFLGKKIFVDLGGGSNYGNLIYSKGDISQDNYSFGNGSSQSPAKVSKVVSKPYFALNAEIDIGIKITSKNYLILGIKQYLETTDIVDARINLTSACFVAFSFR